MNEKQFLNFYQRIKFKEDSSDPFSVADTKRKTLLLNFYGSIYLKEKSNVTEYLLNEDLIEYGKMVDDKNPGKVNNYADSVLALLSNHQNDDMKNWTTGLDDFDVTEHLEPLPCSNSINCLNSKFTEEGRKQIQEAFQCYEETNKVENNENLKAPLHQIRSEGISFGSRNAGNFGNSGNIETTGNVGNRNAGNFGNSGNIETTRNVGNRNFLLSNQPQKEEETRPGQSFFRTARDELKIQNAKKFGRGVNSNTHETTHNYGVVKKCLGTRKGGVYGKFQPPIRQAPSTSTTSSMDVDEDVDERLKNIDPAMIELIKNEIMDSGSKITWDDIAGLDLAKTTIQEIVVWPMLRPDIFTGLRRPPKGILLFGPPGTGKTLIGKCIASHSNSTFFSISASSLTSKWVGDGEKMVRTLFAVAKVHQPSVVFIDEIDSLLSQRSDTEHESSRRIKTEFLVQLDGAGTGDEDRILIIGATNRPQELDEAARRRLVKRLYIPLPDEDARSQIIENLISTERHCLSKSEINNIAKLTKGYSGADVKNLCQEASLGPIRSISPGMIQCINPQDVRPLNAKDFESALRRIKSSVSENDLDIYVAWDKQYGCGSAYHTS